MTEDTEKQNLNNFLIHAVALYDSEKIKVLIEEGADINGYADNTEPYYAGMTALLVAVRGGSAQDVKVIIEAGADVNQPSLGQLKTTPIMMACKCNSPNEEVARLLLESGADALATDKLGRTARQMIKADGGIESKKVAAILDAHLALKEKEHLESTMSPIEQKTNKKVKL
ncbi:MAG TPA: ankyrin repeat domain-containing protein [Anaerovoracaceae bacterium]|nr:ankyrin repeat domain-containing protein [Anaerovoracaceae bacterium]